MGNEFAYHTPTALGGILYIGDLSDADLLAAARSSDSEAFRKIAEFVGPSTNLSWITATCAETAYARGLIDEQELDWLCR